MDGNQLNFPWGDDRPDASTPREKQHPIITRRQRGYQIYHCGGVKKVNRRNEWRVASQRVEGAHYMVRFILGRYVCNCPDFVDRQELCKHIFAVQFFSDSKERDNPPDIPDNVIVLRRDWKSYNESKPWVASMVAQLLKSMLQAIEDPPPRRGNQPAPIAELLFACVMRAYVRESGRDFCGYVLQRWVDSRQISQLYHFNTLTAFMRRRLTTAILIELIRESATPLAGLGPRTIAIDSTGFTTSNSSLWYDHKFGRTTKREYLKLHVAIDTMTHVVTDAVISRHNGADTTRLPRLLKGTRVAVGDVVADKAYAGKPNYDAIQQAGGVALIPPRGRMTGKGNELMRQMFHAFRAENPEVLGRYHQRSNVESVMFMIKAQFGERISARSEVGQINEILAKVLCHNLHCLVMAAQSLHLELRFFLSADEAKLA